MKTILVIIMAVMTVFVNTTVQAQDLTKTDVQKLILEVMDASNDDVEGCVYAYFNGGIYRIRTETMTISCSKDFMSRAWDLPSD